MAGVSRSEPEGGDFVSTSSTVPDRSERRVRLPKRSRRNGARLIRLAVVAATVSVLFGLVPIEAGAAPDTTVEPAGVDDDGEQGPDGSEVPVPSEEAVAAMLEVHRSRTVPTQLFCGLMM